MGSEPAQKVQRAPSCIRHWDPSITALVERRQFAHQSLEGCVTLAERAAARGDAAGAIQWWRRAAEQDPLDTRVALGLVTALTGAGDRPGALRAARRHEQALRAELDLEPDPRLRAAIERLSSGAAPPDAIPGTP